MRGLLSNRKVQFGLNGGFGLVLLAVSFVSARHFTKMGWPLRHADPLPLAAAFVLYLIAYAFKAWGWQRLFQKHERPTSAALAFAGGAACVGGIALPGRIDDAVRMAVVKRFPGTRTGLGTLGISLIVLGMLDNAALTPLASVAAADASSWTVRVGFAVVAAAGVAAAVVVAMLPMLGRWRHAMRWRAGRWLAGRGEVPEAFLKDVPKEFTPAELERWSMTSDTPVGRLRHLAPVLRLSETSPRWARPTVPLGYHEPVWPS